MMPTRIIISLHLLLGLLPRRITQMVTTISPPTHIVLEPLRFTSWLHMERHALSARLEFVCGSRSDHRAINWYCSKAMHWIGRTLAFSSAVRDCLYHSVLDSRIQCPRVESRFHTDLPFVAAQCEREQSQDELLLLTNVNVSDELAAEIRLRHILVRHGHRGSQVRPFRYLFLHELNRLLEHGKCEHPPHRLLYYPPKLTNSQRYRACFRIKR